MNLMCKNLDYLNEITKIPRPRWFSKNNVIINHAAFKLLQFQEGLEPILIVPPQAGHASTIADFDEGKSLVQTAKKTGRAVYAIDWKTCTLERKDETIEDLVTQLNTAMSVFNDPITLIGLCQGGWLCAIYCSLFPNKVKHLIVAGSPIDAKAGGGHIQNLVETYPQSFYERLVEFGGGVMRGEFMLFGWKMMHATDRVKDYYDLWQAAGTSKFRDLQKFREWYEHTHDLAGVWYLEAVDSIFRQNDLWGGRLELFNSPVDLGGIKCPVSSIAGENDDITLIPQALALPGKHIIIPKVGHIGIFMSRNSQPYWEDLLKTEEEYERIFRSSPREAVFAA